MRFTHVLLATSLVALAATGCDDDKKSAESSGTLGELSTAQATTLCKSVKAKMERLEQAFIAITCTDTALFEDSEAACKSEREACIDDPPEDALLDDLDFTCEPGSELSVTEECPKLTVEQLEGCLEQTVQGIEGVADVYSCTNDDDEVELPEAAKACSDLEDICPLLADLGAI